MLPDQDAKRDSYWRVGGWAAPKARREELINQERWFKSSRMVVDVTRGDELYFKTACAWA
jgi:hypothetical protein